MLVRMLIGFDTLFLIICLVSTIYRHAAQDDMQYSILTTKIINNTNCHFPVNSDQLVYYFKQFVFNKIVAGNRGCFILHYPL